MYRILICDDEKEIRESMADYMRSEGLSIALAKNGEEAVEICKRENFDLLILDVRMPKLDGLGACRKIREFSNVPIIFLSAFGEEKNFLDAYQNGGDDYIVKPFPLAVLYEKCISMIKRCKGIDESKITAGKITVDIKARKVYTPSDCITLTNIDFELLYYLCINKGIVLSRDLILSRVWGFDYEGDERSVDTHIKRIRKALGEYSSQIKTVSGVGYCLEEV